MENRRSLIFLALALLVFPLSVSAYKPDTTHKGLTRDVLNFYVHFYPNTFTEEERISIEKGSVDEDKGARALNHFYDPVYNKPIIAGAATSKDWALNTPVQANSSIRYSATLGNVVNAYFGSATDYSWERAIYEYVHGDKKRALEGLGRILHLIEDMAVPDHTRDDPHPDFFWRDMLGQESPYENFTDAFNAENIRVSERLIREGQRPISLGSLPEYFDHVALYSNSNFFSKNTIFDRKYQNPIISYERSERLSDGLNHTFGYNKLGGRLIEIKKEVDVLNNKVNISYIFDDRNHTILTDYWNLLSRQAVLSGAGVVKLFFDEVEREKQTFALYRKNQSLLSRAVEKFSAAVSNRAADTRGDTAAAAVAAEESRKPIEPAVQTPSTASSDSSATDPVGEEAAPPSPATDAPPDTIAPGDSQSPALPANPRSPGFGGGAGDAIAEDTTPPASPVITSPSDLSQTFTSATLSFSGTGEDGSTISMLRSVGGATTTATVTASGGTWSFANQSFDQGTTSVSFTAADAAGNVSAETWAEIAVDSSAPAIGSFSIEECQSSLSSSGCLSTSTILHLSWSSSSSDVAEYRIFVEGAATTTTTGTSAELSGFADGVYGIALVAVDDAGNTATSSDETVEIATVPVMISEVAWAGSTASANDEWIELYNPTSRAVDLSNWTLYAGDGTPYIPLSGTIAGGSYYLIERDDDTAVNDASADLISAFTGSNINTGLTNSGEDLYLVRFAGGATTTIDSRLKCGTSWCGGSSSSFRTMERYGDTVASMRENNWTTALGEFIQNGADASGGAIAGTPKRKNSVSYLLSHTNSVASDKNTTASSSPYLVGRSGLTVAAGVTLTLGEGVVIKVVNPNEPSITVNGTLVTNGSTSSPVVVTAFSDDAYGGDMNGDGSATTPTPGYWMQLMFSSTSASSSLTNTTIRYGGRWFTNTTYKTMVLADSADVAFNTVTLEHSDRHGLYLVNSTSTVSNSVFRYHDEENDAAGVYISSGSPTISDSTFSNNTYGLYAQNAPFASVRSGTFTDNATAAVNVLGEIGAYRSNSGSGNGRNAIVIQGTVAGSSGTTTLAVNSLPYLLLGDSRVPSGGTLTFDAGVIVKGFDSTGGVGNVGKIAVESGGALSFSGSNTSDIVFTSVYDSTAGGSTVSGSTSPTPGDWYGIEVQSGGSLDLSGFTIRYAGGISSTAGSAKGAIQLLSSGATSTIANALFENNYQHGVRAVGNNLTVSGSTFRNHTEFKVSPAAALSIDGATALLDSITFSNNEVDIAGSNSPTVSCTNCGTPSTTPADLLGI